MRARKLPSAPLRRDVQAQRRPQMKRPLAPKRVTVYRKKHVPILIRRERAVIARAEPVQEWEQKIDEDDSKLSELPDEPQERVQRMLSEPAKKEIRKARRFIDETREITEAMDLEGEEEAVSAQPRNGVSAP
mgnify:CR=1 FL=1